MSSSGDPPAKRAKPTVDDDMGGGIVHSETQREALKLVLEGKNVLITGRAGTGKSEIISCIVRQCAHKHVGICAMSGIAASHIHGTTLHSYLGLPSSDFGAEALLERVMDRKSFLSRKRWMQTRLLIVDECSMMDARTLEAIDSVGREVRRRRSQPFGGMQVVLIGDFLQACPIPTAGSKSPLDGRFVFGWPDFAAAVPNVVHLRTNFRQATDSRLQGVLGDIRRGVYSADTLAALRQCAQRRVEDMDVRPTMLFSTKAEVNRLNSSVLQSMQVGVRQYDARDEGKTPALRAAMDRQCQAQQRLVLAEGVQVMLLKNLNTQGGLVNGTLGTVVSTAHPRGPRVRFRNGVEMVVGPEAFSMEANGELLARRTQVPLVLAYALSVHKSQGLTMDTVCVSVKNLGFSPHMLYVALSRVRTLDGLVLQDFSMEALSECCVDAEALAFYHDA